ncbi:hypothetical protein PybrP1_009463, partial [[Pythium] brassicae (nom. inval.)]
MAAPYRHYIQPEADAEFPAEAGRYHLYVAYSCPFACRALSARNLKGLEDLVPSTVDLLPPALEKEIDAANAGIVAEIASGAFKIAFA